MLYRKLGRTGLDVSLLGLGTGGARQMGKSQGHPVHRQHELVHRCLELGINLFDTAEAYEDTEATLGAALNGVDRRSYILVTKWSYFRDEVFSDVGTMRAAAETSLRRLRTDYIDGLLFHGLLPEHYNHIVDKYVPEMYRLRDEGLAHHIGFSERFPKDPGHRAVTLGLTQHPDLWDVVGVKYGILNQLAVHEALPLALQHDVGVVNMAAVRERLPDPAFLERTIAGWKESGYLAPDSLPDVDPLGWLVHGDVESVVAAGYKFAAAHPAVATVLTGTATIGHLDSNAAALEHPWLPTDDSRRLADLFGQVKEYA